MTGTIIFTQGEPRKVVFEGVFEDHDRFINRAGDIVVAKNYSTGRFRKEAYLLVYDRNEGRKLGMIAVIAKETVSGESLGLPYVVSVSHSTQTRLSRLVMKSDTLKGYENTSLLTRTVLLFSDRYRSAVLSTHVVGHFSG